MQSQGSESSDETSSQLRELIRLIGPADEEGAYEFDLELFLSSLNLSTLIELDENELADELNNVDAVDLFHAVQEMTRELAMLKLENLCMTDFLERNNPKLLTGLSRLRNIEPTVQTNMGDRVSRRPGDDSQGAYSLHLMSSKQSMASTQTRRTISSVASSVRKARVECALNYRAKTEIAERAVAELEERIAAAQTKGTNKLKQLKAYIEELSYTTAETIETMNNFKMHFLNDKKDLKFLQTATDSEIERKFRSYMNNWLKNGQALLASIHFSISTLHESCQKDRSDLKNKSELRGYLRAVDFEALQIKQNELEAVFEKKSNSLRAVKTAMGKASMATTEQRRLMEYLEWGSIEVADKIKEKMKIVVKLQHEAKLVEKKNMKDMKTLDNLQERIDRYEAPSVNEYYERILDATAMEKEASILRRKINILKIKLKNAKAVRASKRQSSLMNT